MSMTEWAEKEIELALAREVAAIENDPEETGEDMKAMHKHYASSCYDSALKAYKSMMGDDHSGYSFGIARSILKRLLDGYPLTPIEDVPESWTLVRETEEVQEYQCRRCSSLFKDVDKKTGNVTYVDTDQVICTDGRITYTNGFITKLITDEYPITMPYWPNGRYIVHTTDFALSAEPGVFDTMALFDVTLPDKTVVPLNLYFKETENGFENITEEEYESRKAVFQENFQKLIKENSETVVFSPEDTDTDDAN